MRRFIAIQCGQPRRSYHEHGPSSAAENIDSASAAINSEALAAINSTKCKWRLSSLWRLEGSGGGGVAPAMAESGMKAWQTAVRPGSRPGREQSIACGERRRRNGKK